MKRPVAMDFRNIGLALAALMIGCVANHALAQDVTAGKLKADSCSGCHGVAGISEYDAWPSLRGQKAGYLVTQLTDFREGRRENRIMQHAARALSDADIADLAAYYSSLPLAPIESAPAADPRHEQGAALFGACVSCHGGNGISSTEMWPNLRGQNAGYLAARLKHFRDSERANPIMASFAKGLSDDDINKISGYLASLNIVGMSSAPPPAAARITPHSEVSAGVAYVDEDNRNFGKYNGLNEEGGYLMLDARLKLRDDAAGTWRELKARSLGLDSRELQWDHLRQGDWGYSLAYSSIPRHEPLAVVTPITGIGTPNLTRSASASPVELETKRERFSLALDKAVTNNWRLAAEFRNEEKTGARIFGAISPTFTFGFIPEPIDSTTRLLDLKASYNTNKFQFVGGVYGSQYRNAFEQLNWSYGGLVGAGRLSLPPDNQSYQLYAKGGYSFSPTTRGTFKLAYQEASQTDSFPSPSFTGRHDLDGRVKTTLVHAGLALRPTSALAITGTVRYEDRNDTTPRDRYVTATSITYDGNNKPRDYEKTYGKLEASYTLSSNYRVIGTLEYDKTERDTYPYRSVSHRDTVEDMSTTLALWRSMSATLTGGLAYTHLQRNGSDFYQNVLYSTNAPGLNTLAPYHYADRDSDKIRLSLNWNPRATSSLQAYFDFKQADIKGDRDGTGIGPQENDEMAFAVDLAHYITPDWQALAWYNYSEYEWQNTVRQTFPSGSAAVTSEQTGHMFGVGLKGKPIERVELGANFSYSLVKNRWIQLATPATALAQQLPFAKLRQSTVDLYVTYLLNKRASARLDYIHNRYSSNDPTWTYWGVGAGGSYADGTLVQEVSPQQTNFVGIRYIYQLGGAP